ncbi:hypothetical protein GGTG_09636 [Gaeumannomyces tritici R3-111a-1]|uniref:Uncharacterized protein n=1 Tax=Gaeumannomyces tritici (strain R3-111a-1) TaxID=644352 RepID=J3P7Z8_GAET3|nr:hypothetical protein GGTG_09636 [Gaeumannomyces tritici R3-111a-1]EJT72781.1 hypothetical protein GGTG_09636 [Gaeumannomyces tritici R3-111a-1]
MQPKERIWQGMGGLAVSAVCRLPLDWMSPSRSSRVQRAGKARRLPAMPRGLARGGRSSERRSRPRGGLSPVGKGQGARASGNPLQHHRWATPAVVLRPATGAQSPVLATAPPQPAQLVPGIYALLVEPIPP